jgi:hypothetical protein
VAAWRRHAAIRGHSITATGLPYVGIWSIALLCCGEAQAASSVRVMDSVDYSFSRAKKSN